MHMVFLVLNNPNLLNDVLEAWEKAGVRGITIIESSGLHRNRHKFIPMRYASSLSSFEEGNLTLLAIVENEADVQACLMASERVVGDFSKPNTGIFASWKLDTVKGMHKQDI